MRAESPGEQPTRRVTGRRGVVAKRLRRAKLALLPIASGGGGCLAVVLADHRVRLGHIHLTGIVGASVEIVSSVLIFACALAVMYTLVCVLWCFGAAIRHADDQDMANRWLDLAARELYLFSGGWLKGLRKSPAQLYGSPGIAASTAAETHLPGFWELLTPEERSDLASSAAEAEFAAGSTLCHEGQRADRVWVIRSGRIMVGVAVPGGQRVVAIRQNGDIVGERAALQVTERSATITTLGPVTAYVIDTDKFSRFLGRHPRVLDVIQNQIYGRLGENRATTDDHEPPAALNSMGSWNGQNCTIVMIDIANYGVSSRNDADRRRIRLALYEISKSLFEDPRWRQNNHREDRGDGILLVIPPHVPTMAIVDSIHRDLLVALRQHNNTATRATRIQMRVALHVGPVVSDSYGVDGRAIIHAARLLNAAALRRHLAESGAVLGFITSPHVYDTIIQPNPGWIDPTLYTKLKFHSKGQSFSAWVYLGHSVNGQVEPPAA